MENRILVTPAPHLHDRTSIPYVMWQVVIALIPAMIAAVYFFGWYSLYLTVLGAVAAMATEAVIQRWRKIPVTIADGSAFLTAHRRKVSQCFAAHRGVVFRHASFVSRHATSARV